ncbi:MAG: mannose-1-phosphate guanylyltransferase [Paludibacteraceae bacterium]|nr:mannose-1-phosphate guanylyltransferase [Paludibacteraceae bacterium]
MRDNKNFCVIMAGGIGSRFWPYSRNNKPKQFLDFFPTSRDKSPTGRSLLQMTVDRFRPLMPIEHIVVVTNVAYREQILAQIPDMKPEQVLCEPARRNTAPAIAYAVAHIKGMLRQEAIAAGALDKDDPMDLSHAYCDANIIVAPSDHLIMDEQEFQRVVRCGLAFIGTHDSLLTLGMKPTRPETGYGYIQVNKDRAERCQTESEIYAVKTFTEKPNLELAKVFVESGEFLWNSGIFLWNMRTICSAFCSFLPEMDRLFRSGAKVFGTAGEEAFIQEKFPTCPNISIDYGVLEKAQNVYVLPADFGWSDLGTWGSLYDLSEKDEQKNVTLHCEAMYYESEGNVVTLESGKLAVIGGLKDMIVAESDGVLLICPKDREQNIRNIVTEVTEKYGGKYS